MFIFPDCNPLNPFETVEHIKLDPFIRRKRFIAELMHIATTAYFSQISDSDKHGNLFRTRVLSPSLQTASIFTEGDHLGDGLMGAVVHVNVLASSVEVADIPGGPLIEIKPDVDRESWDLALRAIDYLRTHREELAFS